MERVIIAVIVLAAGFVVGGILKDRNGTKNSGSIPIVVGALAAVLLVASACFTSVPTGQTGVVTTFGRVENFTLDSGIHVVMPWQKVVKMDNRVQKQTLILITHMAPEKAVQRALRSFNPEICQVENMIRVEG